jgi:hypothetical protein
LISLALLAQQLTAPSFLKRGKKFPWSTKEKRKRELWLNKDVYKNDRCSSTFSCNEKPSVAAKAEN